jgi:drug/metabolite transporter (DMT)-like permease
MILALGSIVGTGVVWGAVGAVQQRAVRSGLDIVQFMLVGAAGVALGSWILCADWQVILAGGGCARLGQLSLAMGLAGVANALGFLLMCQAMRRGSPTVVWSLTQSAMVLPFLAGILGWGDPCPPSAALGIALLLGGIVMLGRRGGDAAGGRDGVWLALVLASIVLVGGGQILAGLPSRWPGWQDAAGLRIPLQASANLLFLLAWTAWQGGRWPTGGAWRLGLAWAAVVLGGMVLLFIGLDACAGVGMLAAAYPIAVGTCIVAFTLWNVLHRVEPASRRLAAGTALLIAGIAGIAIR